MTRSSAPLTKGRGRPRRRATSPPWPLSSTSPRSRPLQRGSASAAR
jgi:hypothetical protein